MPARTFSERGVCVVEVVALQPFTLDGVAREAGERFSVSPVVAAALTYQRKAVFPHQYQVRDLSADAPTPRRRRTYRRRDLVAEST